MLLQYIKRVNRSRIIVLYHYSLFVGNYLTNIIELLVPNYQISKILSVFCVNEIHKSFDNYETRIVFLHASNVFDKVCHEGLIFVCHMSYAVCHMSHVAYRVSPFNPDKQHLFNR